MSRAKAGVSRTRSTAYVLASCLLVAVLMAVVLPSHFGASDTFEMRVVGVCAILGALLFAGGISGRISSVWQGAIPALVLLAMYSKKLSDRDAIADMWALTLIYPVLPALLVAAFVCPWLGLRASALRDMRGDT